MELKEGKDLHLKIYAVTLPIYWAEPEFFAKTARHKARS